MAALEKSRRAGKRQAAPFSKGKPKAEPKKPGRKPGKDYGRAARRAIPRQVDEVLDAPLPRRCTECSGAVVEDRVEKQYQTEIPKVKPLVWGFDVHVGHCERCGKRFQGRHPQQTSNALGAAASQLGPKVVAFSAWLHQVLGLPYGKTSDLLSEVYGIDVTPGGLAQAHARLARRGGPAYDHILDEVRQSAAVYPDETSARMNGQRWWLWVFATTLATVYVQRPSRGFDVVEEILGKDFAALLGHDGWAPYDKLTDATHQQCLAHLITRSKELLEIATRGAVRFPRKVKRLLQDALALRDRWEEGELSEHGFRVVRGKNREASGTYPRDAHHPRGESEVPEPPGQACRRDPDLPLRGRGGNELACRAGDSSLDPVSQDLRGPPQPAGGQDPGRAPHALPDGAAAWPRSPAAPRPHAAQQREGCSHPSAGGLLRGQESATPRPHCRALPEESEPGSPP